MQTGTPQVKSHRMVLKIRLGWNAEQGCIKGQLMGGAHGWRGTVEMERRLP